VGRGGKARSTPGCAGGAGGNGGRGGWGGGGAAGRSACVVMPSSWTATVSTDSQCLGGPAAPAGLGDPEAGPEAGGEVGLDAGSAWLDFMDPE
jgi:hypothetical protein